MDKKQSRKILIYLAAAYWALVVLIYLVAYPQFRQTAVSSDALTPSVSVGEVVDGMRIEQALTVPAQEMNSISLMATTFGRDLSGTMQLTLEDAAGEAVARKGMEMTAFADGKYTFIPLDEPVNGRKGETLTLVIETEGSVSGHTVALYAGNTVTAGRFDIVQNVAESDRYRLNGQTGVGKLCVKLGGFDTLTFYKVYWLIVSGAFALAAALCALWWRQALTGKNNPLTTVCMIFTRYSFLIKQLVNRHFKTKYKRSVLGIVWSFLNPLMTMMVQYVVFSTLFKSDIPNYPVYLLSGIVFMNFFNEAVSMGMISITGNAQLIKKVYMPKYIYPITHVLSALINFGTALIPLLLVMLLTGNWPSPALLLLVFDVLCLLGFVTGMSLMLCTAMTFFQDTQFLWGVVSLMWTYVTPVFYPESIIPPQLLTLYHMNPMYQYITFARICIMDGVSPAPMAYLWCILSSAAVLALGMWVFKKNQDKFVLYL